MSLSLTHTYTLSPAHLPFINWQLETLPGGIVGRWRICICIFPISPLDGGSWAYYGSRQDCSRLTFVKDIHLLTSCSFYNLREGSSTCCQRLWARALLLRGWWVSSNSLHTGSKNTQFKPEVTHMCIQLSLLAGAQQRQRTSAVSMLLPETTLRSCGCWNVWFGNKILKRAWNPVCWVIVWKVDPEQK